MGEIHNNRLAIQLVGIRPSGVIHPSPSNGYRYIITTTECFTKWVEAIPLIIANAKQISMFTLNYIFCRYGIPMSIVTNHGKHIKELCEKFHITHHYSTIYYHQGNDQAKVSNKIIVKILKHIINDVGRDCHIQLTLTLWAYYKSI